MEYEEVITMIGYFINGKHTRKKTKAEEAESQKIPLGEEFEETNTDWKNKVKA